VLIAFGMRTVVVLGALIVLGTDRFAVLRHARRVSQVFVSTFSDVWHQRDESVSNSLEFSVADADTLLERLSFSEVRTLTHLIVRAAAAGSPHDACPLLSSYLRLL
jgi:hypothetical protein